MGKIAGLRPELPITAPTCSICLNELDDATSMTKCGHKFHTDCLLNSVAKNSGTEEGTTRSKCPLCRATICDDVVPNAAVTIRIKMLEEENKDSDEINEDLHQRLDAMDCSLWRTRKNLQIANMEAAKYRERLQTQLGNVATLVKKCADLEAVRDRMLAMEEELDIANFTCGIRQAVIKRQRRENKDTAPPIRPRVPHFTFGARSVLAHDVLPTPPAFTFKPSAFNHRSFSFTTPDQSTGDAPPTTTPRIPPRFRGTNPFTVDSSIFTFGT